MTAIRLHIHTKLVSANKRIAWNLKRGFSHTEYKKCKEAIVGEIQTQTQTREIKEYTIEVFFGKKENRLDLDNAVKLLQDALEESGVIQNDRYCKSMFLTRQNNDYTTITLRF